MVPSPSFVAPGEGVLKLNEETTVAYSGLDHLSLAAAERWVEDLRRVGGLPLGQLEGPDATITIRHDETVAGAEAYRLSVSESGVIAAASSSAGIQHALTTLAQMAWAGNGQMQCAEILDEPAFAVRGLMLDCSRHFIPVELIERLIERLAELKMNTLHLHLADDQGWRLQIDSFPELTEVGAFLGDDPTVHGFYSKDDMRRIVACAASRHVQVIPEIDVPGHAFAAVTSRPELCCTGRPVRNSGHQKDLLCAGKRSTLVFLEAVLGEVADVFPAPWVHVGGDEAPKDRWRECPECQRAILENGLSGESGLQAWLTARMVDMLGRLGRRAIGWDETVDGQRPPDSLIVHWWRHRQTGDTLAAEAARLGHDVIASPNSFCYLNFPVESDSNFGVDRVTKMEKAYSARFVPEGLSSEESRRVLGAECALWTEHVEPRDVDEKLFPRLIALAEIMWANPRQRDYADFERRLAVFRPMLEQRGVKFGPE